MPYTEITLLRHGALVAPKLFCAGANVALSEEGWQSLENATQRGDWDQLISSPYLRCKEFSTTLSRLRNIPLSVDNALEEMHFGDWTNKSSQQLWTEQPELFSQLWQSPETFIAPNGESMHAFQSRVNTAWETLLEEHKNIYLSTLV